MTRRHQTPTSGLAIIAIFASPGLLVAASAAIEKTAAPRAPNSQSSRPSDGLHKRRGNPPKAVHLSCPDAADDGTLADTTQVDRFAQLADGLRWEGGYGSPGTCHREVRMVCGPDLDHDGDREAIIQVSWWQATEENTCASLKSSGDYWPLTYTFLAAKHLSVWRAVAPLGVGIFGDKQELRRAADFIKLTPTEFGVLVRWANVSSDNGCQIGGYEIFAYRDKVLRKIETRDESPPCTPCCERP